ARCSVPGGSCSRSRRLRHALMSSTADNKIDGPEDGPEAVSYGRETGRRTGSCRTYVGPTGGRRCSRLLRLSGLEQMDQFVDLTQIFQRAVFTGLQDLQVRRQRLG